MINIIFVFLLSIYLAVIVFLIREAARKKHLYDFSLQKCGQSANKSPKLNIYTARAPKPTTQ